MSGRTWAYVGAVLGAVVSVAANVAHSYVPPTGAPDGWRPQPGAVLGSVFWPVAVVVALEILARVDWPDGRRWLAVRWLGLTPVGVVAAVVSYRHLSGLLAFYGEDDVTSVIGPLAVDGLMLLASGALLAGREPGAVVVETPARPEDARTGVDVATVPADGPSAAGTTDGTPEPSGTPTGEPGEPGTPPGEPGAHPGAPDLAQESIRADERATRPTDEELLDRITAAVESGRLCPGDVTPARARPLLGVGHPRAVRLTRAWQDQRNAGAVRQLAIVGD